MSQLPDTAFRSLFDGHSLSGWRAIPRIYGTDYPGAPPMDDATFRLHAGQAELATEYAAVWSVEEGAIVGRQHPGGHGFGGYLISEETFGDFELVVEANPDWGADTGIMLRRHADTFEGFQVLVDHRQSGGIGGFFGNGLAGFHALSFTIDAEYDGNGHPVGLVEFDPARSQDIYGVSPQKRALLSYGATASEFLAAWKWQDWNEIRVRCEGNLPILTTWINGVKIAQLDTSRVEWPNYDPTRVAERLGARGHIAFEVHDVHPLLGDVQWLRGARCQWRNVKIREID